MPIDKIECRGMNIIPASPVYIRLGLGSFNGGKRRKGGTEGRAGKGRRRAQGRTKEKNSGEAWRKEGFILMIITKVDPKARSAKHRGHKKRESSQKKRRDLHHPNLLH